MKELISVIVPVYNVEKHLKECIDSILNQTYKHIELILIDDGSEDSSCLICDEYRKQDERVIVVHKENGGVSSARNKGLDIAKGDYITFVDSDDYICEDFLMSLYEKINEDEKTDIAFCGFSYVKDGIINKRRENLPTFVNLENNDGEFYQFVSRFLISRNNIFGSVCRVLWRRKVLEGLRFDTSIKVSEDLLFLLQSFKTAKGLKSISKNGYFYRVNNSSCSRSYKKEFLKSQINLYKEIRAFVDSFENQELKKISEAYYCSLAYYAFSNEIKFRPIGYRENIRKIRNSDLYRYFKIKNGLKLNSFKSKIKFITIWMLVKSRMV